jgi:hypothetical protein
MHTVLMHLERLRRHYELAVRTYDQVSFLDLSHSLRIWTELKQPLVKISPKFSTALSFKTAIPAKKVIKAARGVPFVFSYMPGGVITYANNGHIMSIPEKDGEYKGGVAVRVSESGSMELAKYSLIAKDIDSSLSKALKAETVTRCNYIQWLGSEAVRVCYRDTDGDLKTVCINREMIIKRVSNTLDGSHPSVAGGGDVDNTFDVPVQHLLQYQVGGLPLPYFILLKIAQDILEVAPKFLGLNEKL